MAIKSSKVYDDYVKERELLSRFEQAAFDSYEKTILTLSSAFLVFSISFLGIIRKKADSGVGLPPLESMNLLICSWISFAASVLLMLLCFVTNAKSLRTAVADIEPLLEGIERTVKAQNWNIASYLLYAFSGSAFVAGVVLLLTFCAKNIQTF